jgi:hypothetical protein
MSDNQCPADLVAAEFMPADFDVPRELVTEGFRLEPLGPQHNAGDYDAWMSSIDHIRSTPGFEGRSWPRPDMTLEENLGDLRRHAEDFAQRSGFTYTVLDSLSGEIVGCVYIYPPDPADRATSADDREFAAAAAQVRSWVRAGRAELDIPVHDAVEDWLRTGWPFQSVSYAPR